MANNKTTFIGRLGDDPSRVENTKTYCVKFVVLNHGLDPDKNEIVYENVYAFGKQAQVCQKYLHRGDLCCIEGYFRNCDTNDESQKVIAEKITFLTPKR